MSDLLANGVPLVTLIMGLVEFSKKLGVQGKALTALSMALGVLLGIGYQVAQQGAPADFAGWFNAAVFGLALGLTASGVYDLIDARFPKVRG